MPIITSPHDHMERAGLPKTPHQLASITSKISGTLFLYSDFLVKTKCHLQCTLYLPPILTEEAQVAGVHHVGGYEHILSDLQPMTEFHLMDGPYLELTIANGGTMTGSRMAGIVSQHFTSHYLRQDIWYWLPLPRLASAGKIPLEGYKVFATDILPRDARRRMKNRLNHHHTQICTFY